MYANNQHGASLDAVLAASVMPPSSPFGPNSHSISTASTGGHNASVPPRSPTSGTPSFSWPRRVRSPEPYVPLRKASPERLHARPHPLLIDTSDGPYPQKKAHPLLINTSDGRQGYAPATGARTGAAPPYHSQVHAASEMLPPYHNQAHAASEREMNYDMMNIPSKQQLQQHSPRQRHHWAQQQQQESRYPPSPSQLHSPSFQQTQSQPPSSPARLHSPYGEDGWTGREGLRIHHSPEQMHSPSFQQTHSQPPRQMRSPSPYQMQYPPPRKMHNQPPQQSYTQPPKQMFSDDPQRQASWPLALHNNHHTDQLDRQTPRQANGPPLRPARSVQEGLRHFNRQHQQPCLPQQYKQSQTHPNQQFQYHNHSSNQHHPNQQFQLRYQQYGPQSSVPPSPHLQQDQDEVRTSLRSALTSDSSHMDSTTSATSRSSIVTANSSFSDYVKIDKTNQDAEFDVEDALDMYAAGFDTPNKRSLDSNRPVSRDFNLSIPTDLKRPLSRSSLDLVRKPSPLADVSNDGLFVSNNNPHRRSRSVNYLDLQKLKIQESVNTPLPMPRLPLGPSPTSTSTTPTRAHIRTSTQIISGKDFPSLPGESFIAPAPAPAIPAIERDRYGFKKKSQHITEASFNEWEQPYNNYLHERRLKWDALMKKYGLDTQNPTRFPAKSDKVKKYVRKGIPPEWRGAAWFWYAGGPNKLARDPGLYRKLLQQVNAGKLSDNDREHIERDLNRTFPDNILFKPDPLPTARDSHTDSSKAGLDASEPETDIVRALRRVLQAFAVHNPSIGYCQSLNFIAGLLLIFLDSDEEKTFILLNVVTNEHLPGTHGVALEGANIDIAVLMASIRDHIPAVWSKLDDRQAASAGSTSRLPTVSLATTAWFMSLFVGTLPIECVLRVWDCLFFEGSKTLFRVALAIFKLGEDKIKSISDPMEVFQEVQSMPRRMLDANTLMECCFRKGRHGFGGLSQEVVEKRREERRKDVKDGKSFDESNSVGTRTSVGKAIARAKSRGRMRKASGK